LQEKSDDINWEEQTIINRQYPIKTNQTFLEIVADNGLEQIVDFPTRKDNTLDLMLLSHPAYKLRCFCLMVVLIQGCVCRPCVIFEGTLLSMVFCIASFKACQSDSISLFPMFRNVFPNDSRSSFIL
jgi:hypothetical protein